MRTVWSQASSERPGALSWGSWQGAACWGRTTPRSLVSSFTPVLPFHPRIPGIIPWRYRSAAQPTPDPSWRAGPVLGSRQWAWSRAQRTYLGSSRPTFCKPIFLGTESNVPGVSLASSLSCFRARTECGWVVVSLHQRLCWKREVCTGVSGRTKSPSSFLRVTSNNSHEAVNRRISERFLTLFSSIPSSPPPPGLQLALQASTLN